jgi:hypothetical protein
MSIRINIAYAVAMMIVHVQYSILVVCLEDLEDMYEDDTMYQVRCERVSGHVSCRHVYYIYRIP